MTSRSRLSRISTRLPWVVGLRLRWTRAFAMSSRTASIGISGTSIACPSSRYVTVLPTVPLDPRHGVLQQHGQRCAQMREIAQPRAAAARQRTEDPKTYDKSRAQKRRCWAHATVESAMSARSRRARSPVLPLAETRESRPSQPTGAILPRRAASRSTGAICSARVSARGVHRGGVPCAPA